MSRPKHPPWLLRVVPIDLHEGRRPCDRPGHEPGRQSRVDLLAGQGAPSTRCHNRLPRFCVDDVIITSYGAPASPEEAGTLAVYPAEVAQDFDKNTFSVWLFQRFAVMLARAAAQA